MTGVNVPRRLYALPVVGVLALVGAVVGQCAVIL